MHHRRRTVPGESARPAARPLQARAPRPAAAPARGVPEQVLVEADEPGHAGLVGVVLQEDHAVTPSRRADHAAQRALGLVAQPEGRSIEALRPQPLREPRQVIVLVQPEDSAARRLVVGQVGRRSLVYRPRHHQRWIRLPARWVERVADQSVDHTRVIEQRSRLRRQRGGRGLGQRLEVQPQRCPETRKRRRQQALSQALETLVATLEQRDTPLALAMQFEVACQRQHATRRLVSLHIGRPTVEIEGRSHPLLVREHGLEDQALHARHQRTQRPLLLHDRLRRPPIAGGPPGKLGQVGQSTAADEPLEGAPFERRLGAQGGQLEPRRRHHAALGLGGAPAIARAERLRTQDRQTTERRRRRGDTSQGFTLQGPLEAQPVGGASRLGADPRWRLQGRRLRVFAVAAGQALRIERADKAAIARHGLGMIVAVIGPTARERTRLHRQAQRHQRPRRVDQRRQRCRQTAQPRRRGLDEGRAGQARLHEGARRLRYPERLAPRPPRGDRRIRPESLRDTPGRDAAAQDRARRQDDRQPTRLTGGQKTQQIARPPLRMRSRTLQVELSRAALVDAPGHPHLEQLEAEAGDPIEAFSPARGGQPIGFDGGGEERQLAIALEQQRARTETNGGGRGDWRLLGHRRRILCGPCSVE